MRHYAESNRYLLQKSYQPNMLKGWAAVSLLVLVFAVLVSTTGHNELVADIDRQVDLPPNLRFDPGQVDRNSDVPARRAVGGYNPYASRHQGFVGFRRYDVVRDRNEPQTEVAPPVYAPDDNMPIIEADNVSFSPIEGDTAGIYIPLDYQYTSNAGSSGEERHPISRNVTLVRSVRPATPWIARDNNRDGQVDILILIDKTGRPAPFSCQQEDDLQTSPEFHIESVTKESRKVALEFYVDGASDNLLYVVLKEKPKGYYFADKLIEKLPQWVFSPAIKDGEPVAQFVNLSFWYCDPETNSECQEVLLSASSY